MSVLKKKKNTPRCFLPLNCSKEDQVVAVAKRGQNNPNCWQSCSGCSLDIGYQEALRSVAKFYLLIHSFHLFQLEIGCGWGRESFEMCFIDSPFSCVFEEICQRGVAHLLNLWSSRDCFFPPHLFGVLQILMIESSSELSLVLENLPNPWQQGVLFFPPPLASPFVFFAKFLHSIWSKEKLLVCYLSAGCSRHCGKPGWWMNPLKWNLCLASVSINRLGFLHNFA